MKKETRQKKFRPFTIIGTLLASLALVFGATGSANAVTITNPTADPLPVTDGVPVTVTASFLGDEAFWAISVCNLDSAVLGQRCDIAGAGGLISTTTTSRNVTPFVEFDDFDFTSGAPAPVFTETDCTVDDCAIVISVYDANRQFLRDTFREIVF